MADRSARVMFSRRWAFCAAPVILATLVYGGPAHSSDLRETAIVKAVRNVGPSVVNIRGEKTIGGTISQAGHTDPGRRVNGMGTGVVIDERGYVLTNHHVVDGVREIQVTLADNSKHTAKLAARDPETDLAIIKVDTNDPLPVVTIGTSSDLMPGESVIAVGNAYGYENTVTRGIVSALHRAVQVSDAQYYDDLIQTDASINPGNSGGPLLNIDGEMIGINVAVRAGAQGIGFAIPVDKALNVATDLMASLALKSNSHGVVAAKDNPAAGKGMVVASVAAKSPAEKAGLKSGDLVTGVKRTSGGTTREVAVDRPLDFYRAIVDLQPGEQIEVVVRREDAKSSVSLALADPPSGLKPVSSPVWESLGLELKAVSADDFREQYQKFTKDYRGGLVIAAVRPQSPAAEQGLRRGDVLVGMHIWETVSLENVTWIMKQPNFASFNPIHFRIIRGSQVFYGYLPVNVAQATTVRK